MKLIGEIVIHSKFGRGTVVGFDEEYIVVNFGNEERKFKYPKVFDDFLTVENIEILSGIKADIKSKNEETAKMNEEKNQEEQAKVKERKLAGKPPDKRHGGTKATGLRNIAFKCNYCDGGKTSDQMGYNGVCSDKIIENNIYVEKRAWCSDENSSCRQYIEGLMSRWALDEMCNIEDQSFVCYESQMLRDWRAFAGFSHTRDNPSRPIKMKKVKCDSLAVLTTREPNTKEEDRIIFGVFIVDDAFEGDDWEAGEVSTTSEYRMILSLKEARKMKFWNYYFNPNVPESLRMGQGLFRYLTDEQATQILKDIVKVKASGNDWGFAGGFLDHYCKVNNIDPDKVSPPSGTLVK